MQTKNIKCNKKKKKITNKTVVILILLCLTTSFTAENTSFIYPPWKHTWGVRKATPLKLRIFAGNKTKFNNPQGLACAKLESWDDPNDKGDDDEVTVYGVNSGENNIIYNTSMFGIGIYGLEVHHVKFNKPWGIAADRKGNVFVADRGNARVAHLYNPKSKLEFKKFIGETGDGAGQFIDPRGVAINTRGAVYVTDAALGRVTVFNPDGDVLDVWQNFIEPDGIAVIGPDETWAYYREDAFAVVIDSMHQRINKVKFSGEIVKTIRAGIIPMNDIYFNYAVIDYHSQILVTDKNNGCIHKFDRDLNHLTSFGKPGSGDFEFDQPRGIGLNRKLGQLFVAERAGAQYLWVAVDVRNFRAETRIDSIWRDLDIDFYLTEPALGNVDLLDEFDRTIVHIVKNRRFDAGSNHLSWAMEIPEGLSYDQGKIQLPEKFTPGKQLPKGKYILRGRFRALYSSRKHFEKEVKAEFYSK